MLKTLMHLAKGPEFKPQYHKKKKILKALMKLAMYLNIIKAIYDKSIANIKVNEEKLKPFPL
jgi:hypothetical protein